MEFILTLWSDGQTTATASNLTAGTYNVTITDQKGCFKDTSVTVLEPDALLIGFYEYGQC